MLLAALIAAAALSPATPTLGCDDRIPSAFQQFPDGRRVEDPFDIDRRRDLVAGPLALRGLRTTTRRGWKSYVARDQWLKSPAILRRGRTVTIVVPRAQRGWMKLANGGRHRVTLRACARGGSGASGNTAWSFGFDIDYARAPRQGRCARLVVRVDGRAKPLRRRIAPRAGRC